MRTRWALQQLKRIGDDSQSITALGSFSNYYVARHRKVLPPEPHRYLPTRAAKATYLPTPWGRPLAATATYLLYLCVLTV